MVDVARIERLLTRNGERALSRLLTDEERIYCMEQAVPARHVAARVAAKEAAYKALAHPSQSAAIGWREVEVVRELTGRPALQFHGRAAETARRLGVVATLVSLTHTAEQAAAVVIAFQS